MRIKRTSAAVLAATALAAALAACGQAHVTSPAPNATASGPAVTLAGCTAAMEKAGEDALVQGAASGKLPAPVARACNGLSSAETNTAVNTAMTYLMNKPS